MSGRSPLHPPSESRLRSGITRASSRFEDLIYVCLGLLLMGLVVLVLASAFIAFGKAAAAWAFPAAIGSLLDEVLLTLLLVELLYTVQVSFREHALVPEPFLLVGLISVIRRILVITAVAGEQHAGPQPGLVLELAVLGGLLLLIAVALILLRKRGEVIAGERSADTRE